MFDFDKVIDRSNTCSVKFDLRKKMGYGDDVLPLWVADMDFPAPPCIQEALTKAVELGIYGYSILGDDYFPALLFAMICRKIPVSRAVCVKRKHLVGNDLRVVPCHLSYIFRNGT